MKTKLLILFIVSLVTASVNFAYAEISNYPASNCNWVRGAAELNFGGIRNNSTSGYLYIECPAPQRDFSYGVHVGAIEAAWVRVIDHSDTSNIGCLLEAIEKNSSNGMSFRRSETRYSSGHGDYVQNLVFNAMHLPTYYGHAQVRCWIPPGELGHPYSNEVVTYSIQQ